MWIWKLEFILFFSFFFFYLFLPQITLSGDLISFVVCGFNYINSFKKVKQNSMHLHRTGVAARLPYTIPVHTQPKQSAW